ncbi:MAG: nagK [Mucilaginibacter sp.]|jgi:glucokinase|nr:nagK [Mucilaginibacter sp.]
MQVNNLLSSYILTADIGGSHITIAVYNRDTNTILKESLTRNELISKGSATGILISWSNAFQQALKNTVLPVSGLSVAMPGPFDYEKGISYISGLDKYEALYGLNIKSFLADLLKFDSEMIRFKNDAEATIAGEVFIGAGKEYQNVMGLTLGTGFGSAYSKSGITKDINLGSEPYKGTIADDYLSTRWFLRRYNELTGVTLTDGVKELSLLAEKSEVARDVFKEFAMNMIDFLSRPIKQLSPQVLILCGNIAKASKFFLPYLAQGLSSTTIKLAQLGENAPLIGAAAMFRHDYTDDVL